MGLLSIVLLVIFALAALLMILVIMLQDDQGEGIGGLFGGGSSSAFGSRSGNILTRFTAILGAIFIVGAFALAWHGPRRLSRGPFEMLRGDLPIVAIRDLLSVPSQAAAT